MQLVKAQRQKAKIKMSISAPAGFGKTYSALLLAYGITRNWEKIAVLDTENRSAQLYSHLGGYYTIEMQPPFNVDGLEKAFGLCVEAGIEVVIIDNTYHFWQEVLDYVDRLGSGFQNWKKGSPVWQRVINLILQTDVHVICAIRKKQAYALVEENGKKKVEKKGMEDQVRDGFDYEMTIAFDIINEGHLAKATKDRTRLFDGKQEFVITPETGALIKEWCDSGKEAVKHLPPLGEPAFEKAMARIKAGEKDLYEKLKQAYMLSEDQQDILRQFI